MNKLISVRFSLIAVGIGFLCFLGFWIIGSEIDADGYLHEPFALIPLGWIFLFIGLFIGLLYAFKKIRSANK